MGSVEIKKSPRRATSRESLVGGVVRACCGEFDAAPGRACRFSSVIISSLFIRGARFDGGAGTGQEAISATHRLMSLMPSRSLAGFARNVDQPEKGHDTTLRFRGL